MPLLLTLIFLLLPSATYGYQNDHHGYQNEKKGFRDLEWGTSIDSVKDQMAILSSRNDGFRSYTKINEDLQMGSVKVKWISYNFWRSKLIEVQAEGDLNDYESMRDSLIYAFGEPNYGSNTWEGANTHIRLIKVVKYHRVSLYFQDIKGCEEYEKAGQTTGF